MVDIMQKYLAKPVPVAKPDNYNLFDICNATDYQGDTVIYPPDVHVDPKTVQAYHFNMFLAEVMVSFVIISAILHIKN